MATAKNTDLTKHTLNLRKGDLAKMGELFPDQRPSVALRLLISAFVDKHFAKKTKTVETEIDL